MLVLSRRPAESIVFPNSQIVVRLLSVQGRVARIGVEAPASVKVVRGELNLAAAASPADNPGFDRHEWSNRWSKVTLGLHLFQRQRAAGLDDAAEATLAKLLDALAELDREWKSLDGDRQLLSIAGEPAREPDARAPFKALVVDDDDNERELLAGVLGMNGCECHTAANGDEALARLKRDPEFDLVLLDMWMPERNGPQTLHSIRNEPQLRHVKVFSISSTTPRQAGVAEGRDGFDDWLPKPLDPRKLWDKMQVALPRQPR